MPDSHLTWTEPTEEDILQYMQNIPQNLNGEPLNSSLLLHESREKILASDGSTVKRNLNPSKAQTPCRNRTDGLPDKRTKEIAECFINFPTNERPSCCKAF